VRLVRFDAAELSKEQRSAFDCGEPSLDRWLATQARQSMESRDAVTYLLLDDERKGGPRIAGYYALSAGQVRRAELPRPMAKRAPEPVPAIRMGRFAIDRSYQAQGWGADLLRESLLSAVNVGQAIGARVMLVDAISDDALAFYLRFGFLPSPVHPMQVLFDLRVVVTSLGEP
jgi:ribosomal protein S18 acetylase RimI-like enzyme